LLGGRRSRTVAAMEVHVTPETAKNLKDLATTNGRAPDDIVVDAQGRPVRPLRLRP